MRRKEIPRNARFSEPVSVIVSDVSTCSSDRVDAIVTVADEDGHPVQLDVWSKHRIRVDWQVGHIYELSNVRGKSWTNTNGAHYRLSTTSEFSAEDKGPTRTTRHTFLVLGDTHIGYRHRTPSEKASWARNVDVVDGFEKALRLAEWHDVDTIVHAGDVFDHDATRTDFTELGSRLSGQLREGRSFYYIRGNHDTERGRAALRELERTCSGFFRLSKTPVSLDSPDVNLFGLDYSGRNLRSDQLRSRRSGRASRNILVMHEKPYPVVDASGDLLYDDGADLREFLGTVSLDFELIITGHMHVAAQGVVRGYDVPILVTGPTSPISKWKRESRPSAWLVMIDGHGNHIERIEL